MSYAIQQTINRLYWGQLTLSTAAAAVKTGLETTLGFTAPYNGDIQVIQFTNNDPTNTIYLGYDNTVTSTKFWKRLAPGEYLEELMGRGVYATLYAIASAGTPALSVAVLG